MNTCYCIGAGEVNSLPFSPDDSDFVICADGGLKYAEHYGIKPDLVVGDFDSYGTVPAKYDKIIHPCEKDDSDSFLAVLCGIEKGFKQFELYGFLGGRPDHTFSNYQLLSMLADKNIKHTAYGNNYKVYMLKNGHINYPTKDKGIISVFSFDEISRGITIRGLKYEVESFTMTNSLTRGLSNEFCGKEAYISVESGKLIIFEEM